MGRPIVHHNGYFFEWSTVVDAPTTKAMTRQEFKDNYRVWYRNMDPVDERLDRAEKYGTSYHTPTSAFELFGSYNRAGPQEASLPFEEVLRLVGVPIDENAAVK